MRELKEFNRQNTWAGISGGLIALISMCIIWSVESVSENVEMLLVMMTLCGLGVVLIALIGFITANLSHWAENKLAEIRNRREKQKHP